METFDEKVLKTIGKKLRAKKQTVAVSESVTSGLLQYALSQIEFASEFFQGGITTYNLGQKCKHLKVEPIHAEAFNSVSGQVADQMALAVSENFLSDWAISVTGYATPVPASGNKLYCYYTISFRGRKKVQRKLSSPKMKPGKVQQRYVNSILKVFSQLI